MDRPEAIALLLSVPVARLATIRPDGSPHVVPIVFALEEGDVVTAVDAKPKRSRNLARLANIGHQSHICVLADHYEKDWSRLWWVRVDGVATIEVRGESFARAIAALNDRYDQYRSVDIPGPVIRIAPDRVTGWTAF